MTPTDNTPDPGSPQPRPIAPPTQPVPLAPVVPRSKWPAVIGIIAIGLSALGIICSLWSTADVLSPKTAATTQPVAVRLEPLRFVAAGDCLVGVALSIMLMIAAVGLLQRRPSSARLARLWAILDIASMVIGTVVLYDFYKREFVSSITNAGMSIGTAEILFAGLLFSGQLVCCIFPVFVLIWFARDKIQEEVATWQSPPV